MNYKILGTKVEKLLRQMGTSVSITDISGAVGKAVAICTANKSAVNELMATSEIELIISTKFGLAVGQTVSVWNMTITSIEPIAPDGVTVIAYTVKGSL